MSSVDERIVKMVFDNTEFLGKVTQTITSLTQLNKSTEQIAGNEAGGLSAMGKAFQQAEITATQAGFHIRDIWLKVASIFEYQIAGKIVNISKQIANAMTFEGIKAGFDEYELKMGSVQTILAGTGESLQTVNKYLEELNAYSDKTIYSFADMTNNIGKFTNAGVKLEDAVGAIKGIANEAARSGANANEASRAMYNFSQALSAGYVKLIDWKSIENANMATKEFKSTLLEVASAVGTVEKGEDGMYKVLGKNANGATMKEAISATKNFNDSLAYQWMNTEVLTKALKIYSTNVEDMSEAEVKAYESELKAMGLTDAQIKQFEELGTASTKAASEVKTFKMLIDTLKEAIGSGWAQTWEIIIGDFEEAKKLWTEVSNVLGGLIDQTSKARNDMLKAWDALGGRAVLIDSLRRAFEGIVSVITPIADGFRNIFPAVTAKNLMDITKAIQRFTAKLTVTEETATKIRKVASGFFSIFDIGLKFVKALINAVLPASKGITSLASAFLDAAAKVGDFLTKVDIVITKSKLFDVLFQSIAKRVKPVFDLLKTGVKGLLTLFGDLFSGFKEAAGPVASVGDILKNVFNGITGGLDNVGDRVSKLTPIFEGFRTLLKGIGTFLGTIFKQIGESVSGASFGGNGIGGLMNIFNAIMSGGIMFSVFNGIKSFSKIGESFTGVLDGIANALGNFGKQCGEDDALLNAAKAVAIMAGSLFLIATIDSNKLGGATTAITGLMFGLAAAIGILMKAINSFSPTDVKKTFKVFGKELFGSNVTQILEMSVTLGAVAKALLAMGGAVLMMSVGLKLISTVAEGGHLWDSFAVISLMLAELTGIVVLLGKFGPKEAVEGAKNLKGMGTALLLMAAALKIVSSVVAEGTAWEGLAIISIMLGELAGIVILLDKFTDYKMSSMLPLISMAISLNLVVIALKSVSDALGNEGNHIWEALGVISIMLAELAGVCVVMSQFGGMAALGGVGAIMAAAALLILVQALKQISDALGKADQHVWQALGVIAASLITLAVGLTLMAASIPGAAALLIASAALVILAGALKIIATMSLAEIGKGLLAMAGSLILLAVGLTAMIVALPGAIALTVAAFGLTVLAGALKLFGSMSLGEIAKSLLTLTAALTGIAVLGTILSVTSPFLLIFSVALLTFSAALIATGVAMTLFSAGLQAFVAVMPMLGTAITALGTALISLIPVLAEALVSAIVIVATKIVESAPILIAAIIAIIDMILTAVEASTVKIAQTIYNVIIGVATVITENIPMIAQVGADMMIAFMQAISTEIPRIVDEAYKCAIAFVNGLADAINNNNGDLIAAVDNLMSAVIQAITQWLVEFTPLGLLIPENVKSGIMDGSFNVKDAIDSVIKDAVEAIKGFFDSFKQAAEYLIGGLVEGLKGTGVGKVVSAAAELGNKVIGGLTSKKGLDENSPSLRAWLAGLFVGEGLADGIEDGTPEAVDAAETLGDETVGVLTDEMSTGADSIKDSAGEITDAMSGMADGVGTSTDGLTKSIEQYWKELSTLDDVSKVNIKTEERWGSTLKQAEAAAKKSQETEKGRWGTTLDVIESTNKARQATEAETKATEANTEAKDANTTATGKSGKAAKKQADVMEYASGVVEAFTAQYGHLYTELGETGPVDVAKFAIKNLAEQTYKASLKAKEAAGENEKTKVSIEEMIKSFTELKTKIYDNVKSMFEGDSFFQKFELKAEKSMADMLEGMRSNVNAVKNWSAKVAELGNKGLDQGLLKQLAELGPKGYEYINAFSTATTEQIQEANALFAEAGTLPEQASNTVVASYAKAGLNAVAGFTNGIDENTRQAIDSVENLGLTTLSTLEEVLREQSPSKATEEDGIYLDQGLENGILKGGPDVLRTAGTLCERILTKFEVKLDKSVFVEMGRNVAYGLAEGMNDEKAVKSVDEAAVGLSKVAAKATTKYNQIESPSKLYKSYGTYIARGFAEGMSSGSSYVEKGAMALSEAIRDTLSIVKDIAEGDMEMHPVVSPVLDTSELRRNANSIGSLFPSHSIAMASSIGIGSESNASTSSSDAQNGTTQQINFTQNNYSPKALNRIDIYRQTKNQVSMMKGVMA